MIRARAAIAAALLGVSGCLLPPIRGEHVATAPARPPYGGEVRVLMEGAPVPPDAEELGIVTASGPLRDAMLPATIQVLQSEAAALGANAVIRVRYDVGSSTATATGVAVWLR